MKNSKGTIKLLIIVGSFIFLLAIIIVFVNKSDKVTLSAKEIEKYKIYELSISEHTTMSDIMPYCFEVGKEDINGIEYRMFSSDDLTKYLVNCMDIDEIIQTKNIIYINYTTLDENRVFLTYDEKGLFGLDVYNKKKNTFVSIRDGIGIRYNNFS